MKFVEDYCVAYNNNSTLYGYSVRNLFKYASIYVMPMVNPDGVDLVTGEISVNSPAYNSAKKIADSYSFIPFVDGWKANIRGVKLINFHIFIFKK